MLDLVVLALTLLFLLLLRHCALPLDPLVQLHHDGSHLLEVVLQDQLRVGDRVEQLGPLYFIALNGDEVVGGLELGCLSGELLPEAFELVEFDGGVGDFF